MVLDQLRDVGFDPELTAGALTTLQSMRLNNTYASAVLTASKVARTTEQQERRLTPREKKEERFLECRRSLRLWPVPGATLGSLRTYLADKLNMDESFLEDMGVVTIKKVYERRPKYSDEVVDTFETKSIRDAIEAQAHNLASYREEAGMRLHILDHLQKTFRTLMKKRHPDLKWSVKFDDDNWDLFMDVQLGHGQDWKRITAEQADRTVTRRPRPREDGNAPSALESDELEGLLGEDTAEA